MFAPLLLLLLLYFGPHLIVAASLFRWLPSDDLLRGDNWTPSGAAPCADDVVRLDSGDEDADASIALAQLNGPLKVRREKNLFGSGAVNEISPLIVCYLF